MIYSQIGTHTSSLREIPSKDPFQWVAEYEPKIFKMNRPEDLTNFKQTKAEYFISGEIRQQADGSYKRNNESVISKDLIIIDYDDLDMTTQEFVDLVHNSLEEYSYIIYPTISNGFDGTRMRLIVKPDKGMNQHEYEATIKKVIECISVKADSSSQTFSQIQGLPVHEESMTDYKVIVNYGQPFEVAEVTVNEPKRRSYSPAQQVVAENELDEMVLKYIESDWENIKLESNYINLHYSLLRSVYLGEISEEQAEKYVTWLAKGNDEWISNNISRLRRDLNKEIRPKTQWSFISKVKLLSDSEITYRSNGRPEASLTNLTTMILRDPIGESLGFDEFTQEVTVYREQLSDNHINEIRIRLDKEYNVKFNENDVISVVTHLALENTYHPIKDMIESEPWDGVQRAETLFIDYLGAEDSRYIRMATRRWLTGSLARIYDAGCKFELVPVLSGSQGIGKSTIASKLAGEYFVDTLQGLGNSKDDYQLLIGAWIVEIAELASFRTTETEKVKSFISARSDKVRLPYQKFSKDYQRTVSFIGTTNVSEYLIDLTGSRRFLPIKANVNEPTKSVFEMSQDTIQQIWAEVLEWYSVGERFYLTPEENELAESYREEATETNSNHDDIELYLNMGVNSDWDTSSLSEKRVRFQEVLNENYNYPNTNRKIFKTNAGEILKVVFDIQSGDRRERSLTTKINLYLDNLEGWEKKKIKLNGKSSWGYYNHQVKLENDKLKDN